MGKVVISMRPISTLIFAPRNRLDADQNQRTRARDSRVCKAPFEENDMRNALRSLDTITDRDISTLLLFYDRRGEYPVRFGFSTADVLNASGPGSANGSGPVTSQMNADQSTP